MLNFAFMIRKYLELVKFSHSVFALPFALIGYTIGTTKSGFSIFVLLGVIACMILARTAAMAFNRLVDRKFDAANPRTASREIPSGAISPRSALILIIICIVGFVAVAAMFNPLTFMLSPLALLIILGYSYTKRFTWMCHLILGLGLAIAPSAAYIATTGTLSWEMVMLSALVWSWVAGFDIIFALQDRDFDNNTGLHSIPVRFGIKGGLIFSLLLHILTLVFVFILGFKLPLSSHLLYWIGATCFAALIIYQHIIVKPSDLSKVNLAFGTTNGIASIIYATFVILSVVL